MVFNILGADTHTCIPDKSNFKKPGAPGLKRSKISTSNTLAVKKIAAKKTKKLRNQNGQVTKACVVLTTQTLHNF